MLLSIESVMRFTWIAYRLLVVFLLLEIRTCPTINTCRVKTTETENRVINMTLLSADNFGNFDLIIFSLLR
jgi:hypothetical protein